MRLFREILVLSFLLALASAFPALAQNESGGAADAAMASAEGAQGNDAVLLTRPDAEGVTTRVYVGVYVLDLLSVDDVDGTFTADIHWSLRWTDPRLALNGENARDGVRHLPLDKVWNPRVIILNQREMEKQFDDVVVVNPYGEVLYRQRAVADFTLSFDLKDFPLDEHVLSITLGSAGYDTGDVAFVRDEGRTGRADKLTVTGWSIGEFESGPGTYYFEPQDRNLPTFECRLSAGRGTEFYFWRVIFPLLVITMMSWTVFWIDPKYLNPRVGVSVSSILTLVVFQFAIGRLFPPISYLTRMDKFVVGTSLLILLALFEAITSAGLADRGRGRAALNLDRFSRAFFPLAFIALALVVFFA